MFANARDNKTTAEKERGYWDGIYCHGLALSMEGEVFESIFWFQDVTDRAEFERVWLANNPFAQRPYVVRTFEEA